MKSKLELNKVRKKNLLRILHTLFPEYKHIHVKKNGNIIFKRRWFSFSKRINLYELIFTEILPRMSRFRNGGRSHRGIYDDVVYLNDIISSGKRNVVDYLNQLFSSLKGPILVNSIVDKPIIQNTKISTIIFTTLLSNTPLAIRNGIEETTNFFKKLNTQDKYSRVRFIPLT